MTNQHTPGPLTDAQLANLFQKRDAAFARKNWAEQARLQELITVEQTRRFDAHVATLPRAAIAKATGSGA
jgi:hypothetical protein